MGEVTTIGLDLAKHVFQVHGVDAEGATVLRKQLRRGLRVGGCRLWAERAVPSRAHSSQACLGSRYSAAPLHDGVAQSAYRQDAGLQ